MPHELIEEEKNLLRRGRLIPTIKAVRDRMGWGLTEAKTFVENEAYRLDIPFGSPENQKIHKLTFERDQLLLENERLKLRIRQMVPVIDVLRKGRVDLADLLDKLNTVRYPGEKHHEHCDVNDVMIKGKPCNCKGRK